MIDFPGEFVKHREMKYFVQLNLFLMESMRHVAREIDNTITFFAEVQF